MLGATPAVYAQADPTQLKLSGEVRVRAEYDRRTSGTAADAATLLRTRLGVLATLDSSTRAFIQLSDSRVFGEEANTLTDASANQFDLHQAYLEGTLLRSLSLRVGRQELAFADERLVGAVDWANVSRAFDGLRATWTRAAWTLDAFATIFEERDATVPTGIDPRKNQGKDADRTFFGLWLTSRSIELFAIGDRHARAAALTGVDRFTGGATARQGFGRWTVNGMAALQVGRQSVVGGARQDIAAYLASAVLSYAGKGRSQTTLSAQADYLSGDASPADARYTAFNTLYATNHAFYGSMDLFLNLPEDTGALGLVDLILRLSVRREPWIMRADLHQFELARSASTGERAIGQELDLNAKRAVGKFGVQLGYSVFNPSAAARSTEVALGRDVLHWAFLQVTARF